VAVGTDGQKKWLGFSSSDSREVLTYNPISSIINRYAPESAGKFPEFFSIDQSGNWRVQSQWPLIDANPQLSPMDSWIEVYISDGRGLP
jgi:hypothetical protein